MSTFNKPSLITVSADTNFTDNITINFEDAETPELTNNQIISVTANYTTPTVNVTFSNTIITVNNAVIGISGVYGLNIFPGASIKYITRGSSDKYEEPRSAGNFNEITENEQIVEFKPSPVNSLTITYTVVARQGESTITDTFTQTVLNNYSASIPFLKAKV